MPLSDNLRDLKRPAQDFAERRGFTYTVLSASTGKVIGCVYNDWPFDSITYARRT
jgi:hypothetical protein